MTTTGARILADTTLLVEINNLARIDNGEPIINGVTVTATVYAAGTTTALGTVTLVSDGTGYWSAIMDAIDELSPGDKVDVEWFVDGGAGLRRKWRERGIRIPEGFPE